MKTKVIGAGLTCLIMAFTAHAGLCAEINILEYPRIVSQGQQVKLKVEWKNFPTEKDYILRCQLEDQDSAFPIYIFQDVSVSQQKGEMSVALSVPSTITATKTAKFIAAFISKKRSWSDVFVVVSTPNDVEIIKYKAI